MPDSRSWRALRLAAAMAVAGLAGACFQPVYGERPGVAGGSVATQLSAVTIDPVKPGVPIAERAAVEVQNNLLTALQAGAPLPPTHRLKVTVIPQVQSVIVNTRTARPDVENYGLTASFDLTELATGKVVLYGQSVARASYDTPGGQQRFARLRALRDTENRAAGEIADNIRTRIAAYFLTKS